MIRARLIVASAAVSAALCAAGAPAEAQTPGPPQATTPAVEPEALEAMRRMSAYLGTLPAVELTAQTSLDLVTTAGQRIELDGAARYKIRRPNGFAIEVSTALKTRKYFYDGKQFTLWAPELGFYATISAPATNAEMLDLLRSKLDIELPVEDLFRWTDPANRKREAVSAGFEVGPAVVDGVQTDQYAFREGDMDWQIWIQTGAQPLPRKLVIVDRRDPANPAYTAKFSWNVNPVLTAQDFVFSPTKEAKPIRIAGAP